jgi:hypothetical protein
VCVRIGVFWPGQGPVAGSGRHDNEPSNLIKGGEFLDQLSDYQLLKKDCDPWSFAVCLVQPL